MNDGRPQAKALVIDADRTATTLMVSLLRSAWRCEIFEATDGASALALLDMVIPDLVFVAHAPPAIDAPAFTRALRLSDLGARKTPVVMLASEPTKSTTLAARDAGVHEVLREPYTTKDLLRHVTYLLGERRNWVEGISYVGPDRRRFNSVGFTGARKRRVDKEVLSPDNARIGQALRIMKAAIDAIDTEPKQALRALRAQADEIQDAAVAMADFALAGAAKTLKTYLESSPRLNGALLAASLNGMLDSPAARATPELREKKILWVK